MLPAEEASTERMVSSAPSSALRLTDNLPNSGQNTQMMPATPNSAAINTRIVILVPKNRREPSILIIGLAE